MQKKGPDLFGGVFLPFGTELWLAILALIGGHGIIVNALPGAKKKKKKDPNKKKQKKQQVSEPVLGRRPAVLQTLHGTTTTLVQKSKLDKKVKKWASDL